MTDNERLIGRVVAVESDKALIRLEDESKSLTKTFVTGTYPIARINSYVIIPVGSISIVGIVTKVNMAKEDIELTYDATLSLPKPKRTISVSMVGTITKESKKFKFCFGISQFPVLDNPVWFILDKELDAIFDKEENEDYFIELGQSTAYPDYKVKVNPDKLFSRHLGILGNTGSGKSHTIASFLQTILSNEKVIKGKGAHFIIFDTNGEYKRAFETKKDFKCLHIDQDCLRVPYWFMNFQDWIHLLQPKEGSQIPVLSKALTYARNPELKPTTITPQSIISIIEETKNHYVNRKRNRPPSEDDKGTYDAVIDIKDRKKRIGKAIKGYIQSELDEFIEIKNILDVDVPSHFDKSYFRQDALNFAIEESGSNASQIRSYCETMIQRMDRFFNDPRYDFIFHQFLKENIFDSLSDFLRICFGRVGNLNFQKEKHSDEFYFLNVYEKKQSKNRNENYQVIIFDLSLIPSDILQNITALLGRLILEFLQRIEKIPEYQDKDVRGKFPFVMVLEEAHNYIPQPKTFNEQNVSRDVFERISREGRKYGLSLVVSSQRPSELSKTILSQCNSYIVHRIQNPEDQEYIKKLLPSISHDLLKQLPVLGQGIALVFGDCVKAPMQVTIRMPNPRPRSSDPKFWAHWTNTYEGEEYYFKKGEPDFEKICELWESIKKDDNDKEAKNDNKSI